MSSTVFTDFKVLVPVDISEAQLVTSSIAEPDLSRVMGDGSVGEVHWNVGTYAQNARVYVVTTHHVYRDSAGGVSNVVPYLDPVRWIDEGPTNRWAWHDSQSSTASVGASPYSLTVLPGPITHIGFGGLAGVATIRVEMWDSPGGTLVHDQEYGNEDVQGTDPHWALYFLAPTYSDMALIGDLPVHASCLVRITLTGYSSSVEVGLIAMGTPDAVGDAELDVEIKVRDFGYTTTDKWGNSVRTKGAKGIDLNCSGIIGLSQANSVRKTLMRLVDVGGMYFPCQDPAFRFTWTWGLLKPGTMRVDSANTVRIEFEVEGNI